MIRFYKVENGVFKEGIGTKIPDGFVEFKEGDEKINILRNKQIKLEKETQENIQLQEIQALKEKLKL